MNGSGQAGNFEPAPERRQPGKGGGNEKEVIIQTKLGLFVRAKKGTCKGKSRRKKGKKGRDSCQAKGERERKRHLLRFSAKKRRKLEASSESTVGIHACQKGPSRGRAA